VRSELTKKEHKLLTYPMAITWSCSLCYFLVFSDIIFFLLVFFFFFFPFFVFLSFSRNETKIAIIERQRITNYQLTIGHICVCNLNKREPKQMLNIINPSTNQHTKATLNSIIPKTTHYKDEVRLYRLGVEVGIFV